MIVITTPTGLIGHQVVDNLMDGGHELRVIARDPSAIPAAFRDRLDIFEWSHVGAAFVDAALEGADAVFWLAPPDPRAANVEDAFVRFTPHAREARTTHAVQCGVGL